MAIIDDAFAQASLPEPPRKAPTILEGLGDPRIDNYYWMRDLDDPGTLDYIKAENEYARKVLGSLEPLRAEIYAEFLSRIELADTSVPQLQKRYWYYTQTREDSQYEVHLRYVEGQEHQVIIDENALALGHDYFALGTSALSEDEELLAYGIDTDGSEIFSLHLKDLTTMATRALPMENATYGLEFDRAAKRLFWVEADEAMRPWRVWAHELATGRDTLLLQEDDQSFALGISKSKDDATLVIESHSTTSSEAWLLDLNEPGAALELFHPRTEALEYSVEPLGDKVYILSNYEAENFRLSACPRSQPSIAGALDVVPYDASVKLESFELFDGRIAIEERRGGYQRIRLVELATGKEAMVPSDEESSTLALDANPRLDATAIRYVYTSMLSPRSVREMNLATGEVSILKTTTIKGDFDPARYESRSIFVAARDGTPIPVSLMTLRSMRPDGSNPILLYGYGSYEHSVDPAFSTLRLSLCDRGIGFAIAHVRGGGEMGRRWYLDGKLAKKHNTFNDFVDVAKGLCEEGWTSPGKIVSWGGSAGGMLVGAALNQAPELFGGVVAEVPFVDCLTTISDPGLPLTIGEWEEWGNPLDDWEIYQEMAAYSPYDNVVPAVAYPPIMATSGMNDPRVSYFEPAKWVAKIRDITLAARVILWTETTAGHFGNSGRFNEWEEISRIYAFIVACAR